MSSVARMQEIVTYDKLVGGVSVYKQKPVWLAFLKKRSDGRFDPISDPYDSADSFIEIHNPSVYTDF